MQVEKSSYCLSRPLSITSLLLDFRYQPTGNCSNPQSESHSVLADAVLRCWQEASYPTLCHQKLTAPNTQSGYADVSPLQKTEIEHLPSKPIFQTRSFTPPPQMGVSENKPKIRGPLFAETPKSLCCPELAKCANRTSSSESSRNKPEFKKLARQNENPSNKPLPHEYSKSQRLDPTIPGKNLAFSFRSPAPTCP